MSLLIKTIKTLHKIKTNFYLKESQIWQENWKSVVAKKQKQKNYTKNTK